MIATAVSNYPKIPNRPRPATLRKAIHDFDRKAITREDLAKIEDQVTVEVIGEQVNAGLDLVTDGQIRWDDGQTYLMSRLGGVEIRGLLRYFDSNTYYRQPAVVGAVRWKAPILVRDYEHAKAASRKPVKAVLTGPYTLAKLSLDEHYRDLRALTLDLARALREESLALTKAGAAFLQYDEPAILRSPEEIGILEEASRILLDGVPGTRALYTYFGGADGIYDRLLALPYEVLGFDLVAGAGTAERILKKAPAKGLAIGVVDARNTKLETPEAVAETVRRFAGAVAPERLYVNPSAGLEFLPRERAEEKLRNLARGVRLAEERKA
jgi:5-methyltetrahydropteroyltriglutamate--homocysteine methyltransferase